MHCGLSLLCLASLVGVSQARVGCRGNREAGGGAVLVRGDEGVADRLGPDGGARLGRQAGGGYEESGNQAREEALFVHWGGRAPSRAS